MVIGRVAKRHTVGPRWRDAGHRLFLLPPVSPVSPVAGRLCLEAGVHGRTLEYFGSIPPACSIFTRQAPTKAPSLSLHLSLSLSCFLSFFLSFALSFFLACFLSLSDLWVKESRTGWTMKNQQERPFLSFCEFFLFSSSAARVRVGAALNGECLPLVEHSSLRISRIICKGCGSGIL